MGQDMVGTGADALGNAVTRSGGYSHYVGTTVPSGCAIGDHFHRLGTTAAGLYSCTSPNTWVKDESAAPGSLPAGVIVMIVSGACPTGYSEATALNGVMLRGTLASNGNVGTTGGSDTITPAGSVAAATFTGSSATSSGTSGGTPAGTNSAPALTMNSYTPAGTNATPTFSGSALATHAHELPYQIPSTTTIRQIAVATFGTGTSRAATAVSAAGTGNTTSAAVAMSQAVTGGTPAGTVTAPAFTGTAATLTGSVAAPTFTGSALSTHTHTLTATGTNSAPSFTGSQFDNRPAYKNVIFCSKD